MARKLLMGDDRRPIRRALSIGQARQPAWVRRAWEITQEWHANHGRGWVSCEDVAQHVARQLRAEGFDVSYAEGEATYHAPNWEEPGVEARGKNFVDFHAWCQRGRQVFDPKAQILKARGAPAWRYWDYEADALYDNEDES